jgi:hypothetical protein
MFGAWRPGHWDRFSLEDDLKPLVLAFQIV